MTDLGSIDGSQLNEAWDISNAGLIAGTSGDRAFVWQNGVMRELSGRADGYTSGAQRVGPNGAVAGFTFDPVSEFRYVVYWDSEGRRHPQPLSVFPGRPVWIVAFGPGGILVNRLDDAHDTQATVYRNGVETDLGYFPHSRETRAQAMNAAGVVVGWGFHHGAGAGWEIEHPFRWENGVLTDLGIFESSYCGPDDPLNDCSSGSANDINDQGDIVGQASGRSFIWQAGVKRELAVAPGLATEAFFINNAGQIGGLVYDSAGGKRVFLRASDGSLEVSVSGVTWLTGMNERGDILGYGSMGVFIWRGGTMTILPCGPPAIHCSGAALNDNGDVVGWSSAAQYHDTRRAILWRVQ